MPAEIFGVVYVDVNQNGQYDSGSDSPLSGIVMTLTGTDTNGNAVDLPHPPPQTGRTCSRSVPVSGAAGYTLTEAPTPAYGNGTVTPGIPANGTVSTHTVSQIAVTSGAVLTDYDFGEITGGLSGVVYVDVNQNGQYDNGTDSPLSGVQISLSGTDINGDSVSMTTTTAANGTYAFAGLLASGPAGYTVIKAATSAYGNGSNTPGTPANGTVSGNSISSIAFAGGAGLNEYDFGKVTGSLTGVVYIDVNNNGKYDSATDTSVSGVQITLTGTDIDGHSVDLTTSTVANGTYLFSGLLASNQAGYSVTRSVVTSPYVPATNTPGNPANGVVSVDAISSVAYVGGADLVSYNFGEVPAPSTRAGPFRGV